MSKKFCEHKRFNPATGETDHFYPMEVKKQADLEYARLYNLEVGPAQLGYRIYNAVMVPCKETALVNGVEVYIDTPTEVQHRRYLDLIKDELAAQDAAKQDGRCPVPGAHGGTKRCPLRVPNPAYVPGGDQPKTIAKKCESCPFERFKQAHTIVTFSCLETEDERGEVVPYDVPAPQSNYAGKCYEELAKEFVAFVREHKPKLAPLAEKLVQEYNLTDASKELGKSTSTIYSQKAKLQDLVNEFLDTVITI